MSRVSGNGPSIGNSRRTSQRGGSLLNYGLPVSNLTEPAPVAVTSIQKTTFEQSGAFLALDIEHLQRWLRRGRLAIVAFAITGLLAGGAVSVLIKPRFTVTSEILIDPAGLKVVNEDLYANAGQSNDQLLAVGSKLRVLSSGNVLSRVVNDMNLVDDPEFVSSKGKIEPTVTAITSLRQRVKVESDPRSFVASLAVTTNNANKSVEISASMIDAFRDELAKAEAEGANRSVTGLEDRLAELKDAVNLAEERVENYKREKGLQSSAGDLTSQASLNLLNNQVLDAQRLVISEEAAYRELIAGRVVPGDNNTNFSVLEALRAKYAETQQQLQRQSAIYGSLHPAIVQLKSETRMLQTQIDAENNRLKTVAKARLDQAKSALATLSSHSSTQRGAVFTDTEALVHLRELEREAQSKAAIYEAFLARAQQLSERSQLDTTNIQVISTALPPQSPSWPPGTMTLLCIGGIAGMAVGLLWAVARGVWRDLRSSPVGQT